MSAAAAAAAAVHILCMKPPVCSLWCRRHRITLDRQGLGGGVATCGTQSLVQGPAALWLPWWHFRTAAMAAASITLPSNAVSQQLWLQRLHACSWFTHLSEPGVICLRLLQLLCNAAQNLREPFTGSMCHKELIPESI
jgi:hypothetical protein